MGASSIHFTDAQLQCHGTNCGPDKAGCHVNACTQALVDALEAFRLLASQNIYWVTGKPQTFPGVIVHDAYRCPIHNAGTTNSAKNSEHVKGEAADISIPGLTAAQLEKIARKIPAIKGIGRADLQNYIHVDVRQIPVQWCYDARGATVPYFPVIS